MQITKSLSTEGHKRVSEGVCNSPTQPFFTIAAKLKPLVTQIIL